MTTIVNVERKIISLESLKIELDRKKDFIIELADRIKQPENESKDLMDIIASMQYVTLELGQLEMRIRHTESEIQLIKKYESVRADE